MRFIKRFFFFSIVLLGFTSVVSKNHRSSVKTISLEQLPKITVNTVVDDTNNNTEEVFQIFKNTDIHLRTVDFNYFIGWVNLGTPGQKALVVFDTGSSDLWVPGSVICKDNPSYCKKHRTYNPSASSTYVLDGRPFSLDYIAGSVNGVIVRDSVMVAGEIIKNQSFAMVTTVDSALANYKLDGILGLGLPGLSEIPGVDPPFISMIKQGLVENPVFSFFLSKTKGRKSELTLGGVNPYTYIPPFTYTKVYGNGFWIFNVNGIYVDGKEVSGGSVPATPDSGSTTILGPPRIMAPIIEAIGRNISCNDYSHLPTVTFMINNQTFTLIPGDYVKRFNDSETGKETCYSGFKRSGGTDLIILGDIFMTKYLTMFDVGERRIGFALAKQ